MRHPPENKLYAKTVHYTPCSFAPYTPCSLAPYSIASHMPAAINFNAFLTLAASVALIRSLRRTKDLFDMSLEIQLVGVCGLSSFGEHRLFKRIILATISAVECITCMLGGNTQPTTASHWFAPLVPLPCRKGFVTRTTTAPRELLRFRPTLFFLVCVIMRHTGSRENRRDPALTIRTPV